MSYAIDCSYRNSTSDIQVVRIGNVPNVRLERTIWPGHHLMFQAPPQAVLDIYTGVLTSVRIDSIPCSRLHCHAPQESAK